MYQKVELPSILQNTFQYFCRTPLSISAENLTVLMQTMNQYFCRTLLSIFTKTFSVVLQKTSQHVFKTLFIILAEQIYGSFNRTLHNNFLRLTLSIFS